MSSDIIRGSFFFVDIVGLSNPTLSTETQALKIKTLNKLISECDAYKNTNKEKLVLPTGDGMLIAFVNGLEEPLELSIQLQKKLKEFNKNASSTNQTQIRIGCNVGHIFSVTDLAGNKNIWGPGSIMARRVMDFGDADHILLTSEMAEDITEINDKYKIILHPLHDYQIKHNQSLLMYSAYGEDFGNSENPKKGIVDNTIIQKISDINKSVSFDKMEYQLCLNDIITNFLKHSKTYHFTNISDDPLFTITCLITDTEKGINELNLKILDENKDLLQISRILLDTPAMKGFDIKLKKPIFKGEKGIFTVEYENHEIGSYLENIFFLNTNDLTLKFEFPNETCIPKLFIKNRDNEKKEFHRKDVKVKSSGSSMFVWEITNGISINDSLRLEWDSL